MVDGNGLVLVLDDQRWVDLLAESPDAAIFHHPAWLRVLAEVYGYRPFIAAVDDGAGALAAGLPVMEVNSRLTGRRWVSLPFSDYCMPLARSPEAADRLTAYLVRLSKAENVPRLELRWAFPDHPALTQYTHFVLHGLPLDEDTDTVKKQFHRTQRQNIRTAEKNGVTVDRGTSAAFVEAFYQLQLQTRRRQGMPLQPRKFFKHIREQILDRGLGFILLANKDDLCLAAGFFLHWGQTLTYKYAASSDNPLSRDLRPNNLISWTAIQWGCANGCKVFDLGRADLDNEGLRTFKKRWGAEETPLVYATSADTAPSPLPGRLATAMNTIIQKSPPWVCRLSGDVLYRHFG